MKTLVKYDLYYFLKTPKWVIPLALAVFLSALSVLSARYMNTLLEYVLRSEGIEDVTLPPVTVMEAYRQYFTNHFQLFLLVALFLGVHLFTHDFSRHHTTFLFAKPLRTPHYLLSKSLVLMLALFVSLVVGFVVFACYTHFLFGEFALLPFIGAFFVFITAVILYVQVAQLLSVLFKQFLAPLLLTLVVFFLFSSFAMFDAGIFAFLPSQLFNIPLAIIEGDTALGEVLPPVVIALVLSIILFFASNEILKRRPLV